MNLLLRGTRGGGHVSVGVFIGNGAATEQQARALAGVLCITETEWEHLWRQAEQHTVSRGIFNLALEITPELVLEVQERDGGCQ